MIIDKIVSGKKKAGNRARAVDDGSGKSAGETGRP
jgi:hypothetical protein